MTALGIIAPIVGELVKAGFVAVEQQQQAIDHLVAHMKASPPDVAAGYFADRDKVLGESER